MLLYFFCFGALGGALFCDRRALATIVPAVGVLLFIGLRDHHLTPWYAGIGWLFAHLACFEVGLLLGGIALAGLQRSRRGRRLRA